MGITFTGLAPLSVTMGEYNKKEVKSGTSPWIRLSSFFVRMLYFLLPFSFAPAIIAFCLVFYDAGSILRSLFPALALLLGIGWGLWMLATKGFFPGSYVAFHQCALIVLLTCLSHWNSNYHNYIYLLYAHCMISSFYYVLVEECIQFSRIRIILPNLFNDSLLASSLALIIWGSKYFKEFPSELTGVMKFAFAGLLIGCLGTFWLVHFPSTSLYAFCISVVNIAFANCLAMMFAVLHGTYSMNIAMIYYPIFIALTVSNGMLLIRAYSNKKAAVQKVK